MSDTAILTLSFFIGVASSIVATIVISIIQVKRRKIRNRNSFLPYQGHYSHYKLDGTMVAGNNTVIQYRLPNVLEVVTTSENEEYNWKASIFMNENNPESGYGSYEYSNRKTPEWGIIEIKRSQDPNIVLVKSVSKREDVIPVEYKLVKKPSA